MAFPQGIDFRSTSGYVTDPSGCDYEIGLAPEGNYPRTTAQGNSVGWVNSFAADNGRDRTTGNDARLAGMQWDSGSATKYRVDLSATGSWNINLAMGDADYSRSCLCEIFDNTSSLGVVINGSTGAANSFLDATNTVRTAANWPGQNVSVSKTFSTTTLIFLFGSVTGDDGMIAHLNVSPISSSLSPNNDDLIISLNVPTRGVNTHFFPDADVSDGNWVNESESNVNLFASLDEFVFSDSDYIKSGINPSSDVCEIGLSNSPSTPAEPFVVSYRYKKSGTGQIDLVVDLVEGATIRKTWTHNDVSSSFVTQDQTLSSGEFASISDFTNLRLRFTANKP